jgi:hypothetical protein
MKLRHDVSGRAVAWGWCVVFLGMAGCSSLAKPRWLEPGPARSQQRRAVKFDPYLQDDTAPAILRMPINDGTRPRDFNEPMPEVERSRWWAPVR